MNVSLWRALTLSCSSCDLQHAELLLLLQHHLCPLVHKSLSDRPNFPLTLRSTRVVFLLLKQFSLELRTEAEVFLMLLIRIIGAESGDVDTADSSLGHTVRPLWMRVLAMEIMRGYVFLLVVQKVTSHNDFQPVQRR